MTSLYLTKWYNTVLVFSLLAVSSLVSNTTQADNTPYSANEMEKPLTLPKSMAEVEINLGVIDWVSTDQGFDYTNTNIGISPIIIRYGISDNLQLQNAGLAYRVYSDDKTESSIFGGINSFVYHSRGDTNIEYSFGLLAKQRINNVSSMLLQLYNNYLYNSSYSDEKILGVRVSGYYTINNTMVFSLGMMHEKSDLLNDLRMSNSGLSISLQNIINKTIDLNYMLEVVRFSEDGAANNNFSTGRFTVSARWRWEN